MPVGQYPFIDIAVHGLIRERFAEGEALVLLSADLGAVIWADGAGAELFGYGNLYEFMDDGALGQTAALRQLKEAASRLRASGNDQNAMLRLASGFRSRLVPVSLTSLRLADGTPAVLLSGGTPGDASGLGERARRVIAGLGGGDTHVAVLDAKGGILAASPQLGDLSIAPDILAGLVADVTGGRDRLVKRLIPTARGRIPAAIARLADEPALHLLFAIETEVAPSAEAAEPAHVRQQLAAAENAAARAADADKHAAEDESVGETEPAAADGVPFRFDPKGKPVRFAWKIDAKGRFSEISPDFAAFVGPNAADVVGRRFEDVARVFGFDRDHVIAGLLRRHDTWSGKSVLWPVQGTSLAVPVDLAALPTYTRDRTFDGFRGFGIVRVGDAAEDLEAIGLSLVAMPAEPVPATPEDAALAGSADESTATEDMPDAPPASDAGTTASAAETAPDEATAAAPDEKESTGESDPFGGETPALRIVPTPGRRESDKVIELELRRPRPRDLLSSGEQAAFREIGKRLSDAFGRKEASGEEPKTAPDEQAAPAEEAAAATEDLHDAHPAAPDDAAAPEATGEAPQGEELPVPNENAPEAGDGEDRPATEPVETTARRAPNVVALPSAFAVGRSGQAASGLDESVLDDLPIALLVHCGEALHYANPEFLTLTGYAGLEALREAGGLGSLFGSSDYANDAEAQALPGTMRLIRADGGELAVHARLQSVAWHEGRALMLSLRQAEERREEIEAPERPSEAQMPRAEAVLPQMATANDATPDAAHAAALQIEVEELRSILETATDGVVILGEHGDIRSMNRSASALFDYDEADTRGQPFAKLFAHESQRAVMDYLTGLSEHGVASVLNDGREVIGREASGGFIPLFMTIGRLSGSNGFCAVMRDITQWKRTEEELRAAKYAAEQASSHKSEFLARVSHEIRTPLNAIIGFADMMAEQRFGPVGSPRYLEYAHDIGRSGKHVLDIVNDLLDISKIEAGEMEVAFAAVALNDTIAEAVSLLQPQANSQRVIIRTSLSSSVPEIVADQRSIKQIALNLLANAIRFTPAGGQIVVSTAYEANGSVVLRIRDTGIGMSRSELEQALKPFRQIKGTSRPRGDGTGLGLPLTKAMVEANRAQFEIRSAPQEGTLIEITFPSQRVLAD